MATIFTGINRFLRLFVAFIAMVGFVGLSTLHVLTLPQETPRSAIIRLVGVDIAPQITHEKAVIHHKQAIASPPQAMVSHVAHDSSKQEHHTHDGMHCPLCPLFVVSVVSTLLAVLLFIVPWITTTLRRTPYVARIFAKSGFHFLPPVRGPPIFCPV